MWYFTPLFPLLLVLISWRLQTGWLALFIDGATPEDRAIVMTLFSSPFHFLFQKRIWEACTFDLNLLYHTIFPSRLLSPCACFAQRQWPNRRFYGRVSSWTELYWVASLAIYSLKRCIFDSDIFLLFLFFVFLIFFDDPNSEIMCINSIVDISHGGSPGTWTGLSAIPLLPAGRDMY